MASADGRWVGSRRKVASKRSIADGEKAAGNVGPLAEVAIRNRTPASSRPLSLQGGRPLPISIICGEVRGSRRGRPHRASKGPDVRRAAVAALPHHLGRDPIRSPNHALETVRLRKRLAAAKVGELDDALLIDQDIRALDVYDSR